MNIATRQIRGERNILNVIRRVIWQSSVRRTIRSYWRFCADVFRLQIDSDIDIYQRKRKEINDRTDELGRRYRKSLYNVKRDCVSLALLRKERYLQDNIFLLNNYRTYNHEIIRGGTVNG